MRMALSSVRLIPHLIIMTTTNQSWIIKADLVRWAKEWGLEQPRTLNEFALRLIYFMTFAPEFRNVFYMRGGAKAKLFSWLCKPLVTLEIEATNIGSGLFIQHGGGTYISADRIGDNCWINQQVTIGYSNRTDRPTIGDNVKICAGAKIIGKVRIGDNATVGLNTVVIDNVAPNTTVFGMPAKVVWSSRAPSRHEPVLQRQASAAAHSNHNAEGEGSPQI
jgi:serine O-acetyltransferase